MSSSVLDSVSLKDIPRILGQLTEADLRVLEAQLVRLEKLKQRELAQERFEVFVRKAWPTFIGGRHHKIMANAFERVARG